MARQNILPLAVQDHLRTLAQSLDAASYCGRGQLVDQFAAHYDWSRAKVYRELRKVGWSSGRKPRSDLGSTTQCLEALTELSAVQRIGVRKNGKITMQTPNARSLLSVNGRSFSVTNARLNALLKARQMDVATQKQDRACQPLRSLHPNHVHLVDPSLCLIYYDPAGKQHVIRDDQYYKNKPDNIAKIEKWKVWRYVLVDHYSSVVIVRYYRAKGETQANLYDFLLYAWQQVPERVFHGVPKILYWDKGSANTSHAIKNALQALQVTPLEHTAGNPRAKGAVEQANNLVEKLFESRLRFEPVASVDELNTAVIAWTNAYNSDTIPHYDARLKRRYMAEPKARYALWQIIRQENLRLLPDESVCRYLLSAKPEVRKVRADLTVSIRHPMSKQREHYDVADLPNVYPNAEVMVSPLIYGECQVVVSIEDYKGEEVSRVVSRIERDAFSGFRMDAAVIGDEWKSQPDTTVERAGKAADHAAYPDLDVDDAAKARDKGVTPFGGELDAHSHLQHVEQPGYMRRPGSEMSVPDRVNVTEQPMTVTEACKRLVADIGKREGINYHQLVRSLYPEGVPESEYPALVRRITHPAPTMVSAG